MKPPQVAFLDLDGTILDSAPGIVAGMREAYAAAGLPAPDEATLRSWIGPPVLQTLERELGSRGDDVVRVANEGFRAYFDSVGATQSEVFAGMPEAMVAIAAAGATIVVVTHKPLPLAERALADHDLRTLVSAVHAPASPNQLVPKEVLFENALRSIDTGTADVVAVGDRDRDIHAASSHGMGSIGVAWGYGTASELADAGAVAIAECAADLPGLVVRHMQRVA